MKHFTVDKQSWAYFLYEYAGIFGMLASGYLSDKVFKGHRAPPMLLFLVGVLIAIVVYWKKPAGNPLVDNICLVAIGFLIYGPVMMIGLQAVDLVPRVATGTATGLTGLFSYLLGSASAGWVMGKLVDVYGWDGGFFCQNPTACTCNLPIWLYITAVIILMNVGARFILARIYINTLTGDPLYT
ncbi:glycerol-3-phosphate transporter domain protein [Glaesserella parasuis 29755]|nr:glpT glycerol-3-P MFS transporter domain protein [Glaesserella parasuis 84-15995]EQA95451.1 glycerol-3-phosphate transporter domain protein [Glaesserella parasuis 29755]